MTTGNTSLHHPWSVIGPVQLMPGYAYGFAYPVILLNLAIPALPLAERQRLQGIFEGLLRSIPDLPALPAPDAADRPEDNDHIATVRWFAQLADHIAAMAQLPVTQVTRCVGLDPPVATFAVPGTQFSRAPHAQLLLQAARLFSTLAEGDVSQDALKAAEQVCRDQFTALRQSAPNKSNVPRLIKAAVQNGIVFQEVVGTKAIQYGLGRKAVMFDSSFTQFTPTMGTHMARIKSEAAAILRRNRLPVPAHQLARDEEHALQIAEQLGYPVVVKPADRDGGVAVQADLRTGDEVVSAYRLARQKSNMVLVEQFAQGNDYRLTVFRDQCVWAIERVPAGVTADGRSTIQELVDSENANPARGTDVHAPIKRIKLDDEALGLLAREGFSLASVPPAGQFIKLRRASNISSGGMPVAVTDRVHPDNAALAVRAARAMQLDVAGIDLIIPDIAASWKESGGVICEVNAQPQLGRVTGSHLYAQLLQTMLGGDGNVPVIAILGGKAAENLAHNLTIQLSGKGIRAGLHSKAGVAIGPTFAEQGPVPQLAAGQMLSINPDVDALIFSASDGTLLRDGFPVPRIDILLLTGEYLDRQGADPQVTEHLLLRVALRMLAPAARCICLLEGNDTPAESALHDLSMAFQRASLSSIIDLTERLHRGEA